MIVDFRKSIEGFVGKEVTITKVGYKKCVIGIINSISNPHCNVIIDCPNKTRKFIRGSEISEISMKNDR